MFILAKKKPQPYSLILPLLAFLIAIPLASFALGSADLVVGIYEPNNQFYAFTDYLNSSSEVTVFASENTKNSGDVIFAVIGDQARGALVNGKSFDKEQAERAAAIANGYDAPYFLWNLGDITSAGWSYAFEFENQAYYKKTFRIDGFIGDVNIRAFIDSDNDYYYSLNDVLSGFIGQTNENQDLNENPFSRLYFDNSGRPVFTKAYDGTHEPEDIITAEAPYLLVNGVQVAPLADDHHDLLIRLRNNVQVWTLLKEFTPWLDVNIFGLYLDAGRGRNTTTIFEGPRNEGHTFTTAFPAGTNVGLWLLNDINGDTIYNYNDSWLFSERFLTLNSFANEHQWFRVYDVGSYKGTGAFYEFFCSADDFSTMGDFDYLIYIDDDHTSANWDHNDMIIGVNVMVDPDDCGNYQPGVPPNYSMVDSSYFIGEPILPLPPPDSGGVYIYLDTSNCYWTIASHIYSQGNSLEQFHGSIVSIMDEPPQAGYNIFIDNFELWEDTTSNRCLQQNDRWGWSLWDSTLNLYEIWWDVTTKEYKPDAQDVNDFLIIRLQGTAIDFNLWSSGHGGPFDEYEVFLGANKIPLGTVPGYHDYGGFDVIDQYQAAVGPDPSTDPNTSVFSTHCGPGESYNGLGEIDSSDSYYCDADYGSNYAGPKTYQADGIQFSAYGSFCVDPCLDNSAPVCNLVNDTTYFVCGDTTFDFYITAFDPDENLVGCTKTSGPGTYYNEHWTFTTTGPRVFTASFECVDYCGASCSGTVNITVEYNSAPIVSCPENWVSDVCSYGEEVCSWGFGYYDADNNIVSIDVIGGTLFDEHTICFTPTGPTHTITLIATDECGEADTCVADITVRVNTPPVAECPPDTSLFVCDYSEICIPGFTFWDRDDNIDTVLVFGCEIFGDTVCFVPEGPSKTITFIVIDECGAADTCATNISIILNSPPTVSCPGDTSLFVCDLSQICIDGFSAGDPDNNLISVTATGGVLNGSVVCFTPVEGTNTIILTAIDDCGETAACTTAVNVVLNSLPQVACPDDTTLFVCDLSEICLPGFSAADPDGNIVDVTVTGGTLSGNEVCFTPVEGINTITLTATDACGAADQCATQVTVVLNSAPAASCPGDTSLFLCELDQICLDGFIATDPDNNITSTTINQGGLNGSQVCFTPVEGLNTLIFTVTDVCGQTDQCSTLVNVSLNEPPTAECPSDTSIFLCELTSLCLDGFIAGDSNNNIASVAVSQGVLSGTQVCFTPVEGANTIVFTVVDDCGDSARCVTNINVSLNGPPQAFCPGDTSIFYCINGPICLPGFGATDPDDNIVSETVSLGTLTSGTVCFTPVEGANTIVYTVTDACGQTDQCQTVIYVQLNDPPQASCPSDTTLFVCDPGDICIDGFVGTDPDDNITSMQVSNGVLNGTQVCFSPVEGLNTIVFTVTDACGETDQCQTSINVIYNNPPVATCPGDTTLFLCTADQVCLDGFGASDPDGNIQTVDVSIGTLVGDQVCFTPVEGVNTITLTVTDACGQVDQCVTNVTVAFNEPPVANCPGDDALTVCNLTDPVCIDGFTYGDPDNNITSVSVNVGTLIDGQVCFTPVEGVNTITLTVTDACGATAECSTNITVTLNSPPQVNCPDDRALTVCNLTDPVCIDGFTYSDADDNITGVSVNVGTLISGQVCFTPVAGVNTITLTVTDTCGATAECSTDITVTLNSAPAAVCPNDTSMLVCDLSQICLDGFSVSDPDNNIQSTVVQGGTLNGDQVCFTPVAGVNTIILTVTDSCGLSSFCETNVTVILNNAPVVNCPDDVVLTVCDLSDICIDGFTYSDADDNITSVTVSGGTLNGSEVCFTPVSGLNTLTLTVTDACGEVAECVTLVTVTLNSPPAAVCAGNIDTLLCDLSAICIDGFSITDADDNIDTVIVAGGTLSDGQVCFTPVEGLNTITVLVTDECGETAQCFTEINVTLNSGPAVVCPGDTVIQVGDLAEICLTGFGYSDPDDNLSSVSISNGTLSGDTVCFIPVEGLNVLTLTATDECGLSDECTTNITIIRNTCPIIVRPFADTTVMCLYEDFCDTIEAIDADGDYIDMTVNYGQLIPIVDEPGHWLGLYCFGVEDYDCGEHNNYEVIIQCDDGQCSDQDIMVVFDITVLGYIDMFLDEDVYIMPGMTGLVGVYLDTYDCLCIGGFTASLFWDSSILNLVEVFPTQNLDNGNEYHNVHINAFGPGTVKLSYIADLNNQIYHGPLCEIDPNEPLFYLEFLVTPGQYPVGFEIPICFINEENINDNAVSDSTGYHVWYGNGCSDQPDSSQFGTLMLNQECGSVIIINECDLVVGDVNINRVPFEVGDAVLLANHLIDPDSYPFSIAQLWSSDVNGDSVRASIADLIMMINVINGTSPLGKVTPPDTPVNLVVAHHSDGSAAIRIASSYDVGGLVLDLPVPDLENRDIEYNTDLGMDIEIREYPGGVRMLIYSSDGTRLNAGDNEILRISNAEGLNINPAEISIADARGALADARITCELPLPETFGITSCYPNPFNPTATIRFTMPTPEFVSLKIYDVAGRVVDILTEGYLEAGYHEIYWHGINSAGKRVSSGVYFAKLEAENHNLNTSIEKLILLK